MNINALNGNEINSNKVNIHDDILDSLFFERSSRDMCIQITKASTTKTNYTIRFSNVVGFEMTSCDFWGASQHIFDFEYISPPNRVLLPKLQQIEQSIPMNNLGHLSNGTEYIEVIITFTSGDHLRIACESLVLSE